ncbi:MAG: hypothetical protein WB511_04080, partial [Nitrososphaeraceae archaeon]
AYAFFELWLWVFIISQTETQMLIFYLMKEFLSTSFCLGLIFRVSTSKLFTRISFPSRIVADGI